VKAAAAPRPSGRPTRPYRFPAFTRRRLDNGVQLIVAPVHKLPVATLSVVIDAGATADPPGLEGIAQLTADLLLEGTAAESGAQLAERFERLGAAIETVADWDATIVSLTALKDQFVAAARLLGDVLRAPAFPQAEVDRLKTERRTELVTLRTEPRGLADEMFVRVLYSKDSRYGCTIVGTERSVDAISRNDIRQFHEARYRAGGVTVIVVGDVTAEDAETLVAQMFADWAGGKATASVAKDAVAASSRRVHVVAMPDAQQVELRIGHVGIPRGHADYFPVVILNAVLGGLFSSRINLNLREKHGYTYGASSRFDWRRQSGPFVVATAVATDVTAEAAKEALLEIERIVTSEIEPDELSLATSYLDGVFPIRFETTASIAAALVALTTFGLPDDYHDRYRDRIRAVSTADVLRVAQAHLKPASLQLLAAGDADRIREPLAALDFGPLSSYQPSDLP